MKDFIDSPLFYGIDSAEFKNMQRSLCVKTRTFSKKETIFRMGDVPSDIGVVKSGSVIIERCDPNGNAAVLGAVNAGGIFAESYALGRKPLLVDALAAEDSVVIFVPVDAISGEKYAGHRWQNILMHNLLCITAEKNISLSSRIFCTTQKSVRGRVLAYLSEESVKAGSAEFRIQFDRQRMADYLNVDRSALSKELGRMKNEGLIDFHKDRFTIKNIDAQ